MQNSINFSWLRWLGREVSSFRSRTDKSLVIGRVFVTLMGMCKSRLTRMEVAFEAVDPESWPGGYSADYIIPTRDGGRIYVFPAHHQVGDVSHFLRPEEEGWDTVTTVLPGGNIGWAIYEACADMPMKCPDYPHDDQALIRVVMVRPRPAAWAYRRDGQYGSEPQFESAPSIPLFAGTMERMTDLYQGWQREPWGNMAIPHEWRDRLAKADIPATFFRMGEVAKWAGERFAEGDAEGDNGWNHPGYPVAAEMLLEWHLALAGVVADAPAGSEDHEQRKTARILTWCAANGDREVTMADARAVKLCPGGVRAWMAERGLTAPVKVAALVPHLGDNAEVRRVLEWLSAPQGQQRKKPEGGY